MMRGLFIFGLFLVGPAACQGPLQGDVGAVVSMVERVLPGAGLHFNLAFESGNCQGISPPCFEIKDEDDGRVAITATSASELSAGVGHYLREVCNMTIGWPRGGGSNVFIPRSELSLSGWPKIPGGAIIARHRAVPWSYIMNVCTHSYSLVWYDWADWQAFIDWMALNGINNMLVSRKEGTEL